MKEMSNKMRWNAASGSGIGRTCTSTDLPHGACLTSYQHGDWCFTVDLPEEMRSFSIDELEEIIHKLKQLNERDTHNGRDTYRERAEEQIPEF